MCRCLYLSHNLAHFVIRYGHLAQYALGLFCRQPLKVFSSRRYYQSCHIERARTDKHLGVAVCRIAVGSVLAARKYHRQPLACRHPAHNIHHRLYVAVVHRQSIVHTAEESLVGLGIAAPYQQGRTCPAVDD
jgi:hypothetical protein